MSETITKYNYSVPHADELEMTRKIHPRLTQITPVVFEWGELMTEVHKRHLWLCYADSYKEYCEKHLNITRQRAYQMMSAWEIRESLPEECQIVVDTETKARALAPVPPRRRARVIQDAVEASNGHPTARDIAQAAERATQPKPAPAKPAEKPPQKEILLDSTGWPVPDNLEKLFNRADEVKEVLTRIASVRGLLRRVEENKDVLWQPVSKSMVMADLVRVYYELKMAIPYVVCPHCQGRDETKSHCTTCGGRGALSEHVWRNAIPEELKAVREKSCKK